jgi:hypothetical protein
MGRRPSRRWAAPSMRKGRPRRAGLGDLACLALPGQALPDRASPSQAKPGPAWPHHAKRGLSRAASTLLRRAGYRKPLEAGASMASSMATPARSRPYRCCIFLTKK